MSYEPTIFVRKKDLESQRDTIETNYYKSDLRNDPDKDTEWRVWEELLKAINDTRKISFDDVDLLMFTPEFTKHNQDVRSKLYQLDIEYKTYI